MPNFQIYVEQGVTPDTPMLSSFQIQVQGVQEMPT